VDSSQQKFLWGAATAALQVEGAVNEDGRGPSMWDVFCHEHPELIHERATPDVACDHYHRWREDVGWMRELGLNAYRFSIAWPRVVPDGGGALNARGLDFYDRLVDALRAAEIEPHVTLYHWDLPQALAAGGGWESRDTIDAFLGYVEHCVRRLGDRVQLWSTLNEPGWSTLNGYVTGLHPPQRQDLGAAARVSHHLMLAHARAARVIHDVGRGAQVGIALNLSPVRPASPGEADVAAARLADGVLNRWYSEAAILGRYPPDVLAFYEGRGLLATIAAADHDALRTAPLDFIGVNYYYPHHATADAPDTRFFLNTSGGGQDCDFALQGLFRMVKNPRGRYTAWGWEIEPDGLREALLAVHALRPGLPLYVTENGIGLDDRPLNGAIEDPERIAFLADHLEAVRQARAAGADVRGFFVWALMDNFSWLNGYKKRYGLLHVDRQTLVRTPKASARWYRAQASSSLWSAAP
jgi:beta-galactosidase